VTVRKDGRVCAVGGWDGKYALFSYIYFTQPGHLLLPSIRLYGTKNFKVLGTLTYHKQGCGALAFANQLAEGDLNDDDEGLSAEEKAGRRLWLASGGKDSRVCMWPLSSFSK
jgi:ASTRA-associated protein 1